MLGELVPCAGGPPIPLRKPKLLLGRQPFCDVPLCYPSVSSRHCELEFRDGFWFVRDLGSSNGTRVNGTPCESNCLLPNDVLALSKYRYTVVYTAPAGRAPPRETGLAGGSRGGPAPPGRAVSGATEGPTPRTLPGSIGGGSRLGELIPCGGGDPIPLHQPRLVVGRHDGCDVVLRSSTVSGRHCQLEWTDGSWFVRDLGSRHGIRVDGVPCEEKALPPGSVLWIANQRYRIVYARPGGGPAATKGPVFAQSLLEAAGLTRLPTEPPAGKRKPGDTDEPPRRRYTLGDSE
jgi:adenylate cyclase